MAECPSRAAERYLASQELPEECPTCGGENSTESGEWVCADAPGFCSVVCQGEYLDVQRAADDAIKGAGGEDVKTIAGDNSDPGCGPVPDGARCEDCGAPAAYYGTCPYETELAPLGAELQWVALCDACAGERSDDI